MLVGEKMTNQPIIKFSSINKTFKTRTRGVKNKNKAVQNVTFEVNKGEVFGLVGESGSGKSTIANLLMNLEQLDSGEIHFEGKKISDSSANNSFPYGDIQIVFQDPRSSLDPRMNIGQIIQEPLRTVSSSRQKEFGSESNLLKLIQSVGLRQEHLDRKPHQFSGGQRQRLGIARAMFTRPKMLVLDEATSSLDGQTEFDISAAITNLKGTVTVIMIAHRLSTVRHADQIVYLRDGRILATGTFDEVRSQIPDFDHQAGLMGL